MDDESPDISKELSLNNSRLTTELGIYFMILLLYVPSSTKCFTFGGIIFSRSCDCCSLRFKYSRVSGRFPEIST